MRILYKDLKANKLKLQVENLDDLWYLYNLIEPEDLVFAVTYRREEKISDKLRPERREKKRVRLGIRVEALKFQEFSDRLRVGGKIEQGEFDLGKHHTLTLGVGDSLTLVKEWSESCLERIKQAVEESKRPMITFLALDYGEATFAVLHSYGIEEIATLKASISGKQYKGTKNEKNIFYNEVLEKLKQARLKKSPLIILGPGFAKEEFYKLGKEKEPDVFENCFLESSSSVGIQGINELLKRGFGAKVVLESRVAFETQLVEKLLTEIAKGGDFSYGYEEVKQALEQGACENLLVTDKLMRTRKAAKLFKLAKSTRAKTVIVSTVHEGGKKLDSLGGVGALLRYKIS